TRVCLLFPPPRLPPTFLSHDPATPQSYTLSLHDALPISFAVHLHRAHRARLLQDVTRQRRDLGGDVGITHAGGVGARRDLPLGRSEEHTSELQSRENLVCRLLLEKKNPPHDLTLPDCS